MLTALSIANFKIFDEEGVRLPIRPLTLIYGVNSVGKSSVLQAILYLDQALNSGSGDVSTTRIGGSFIDLGGFRQIVHNHDQSKRISFTLEWALKDETWSFNLDPLPEIIALKLEIGRDSQSAVGLLKLEVLVATQALLQLSRDSLVDPFSVSFSNVINPSWGMSAPPPAMTADFALAAVEVSMPPSLWRDKVATLLNSVRNKLSQWLNSITYTGPVRAYPDRALLSGFHQSLRQSFGDPEGLWAWHNLRSNPQLRNLINQELLRMHAPHGFFLRNFYRADDLKSLEKDLPSAFLQRFEIAKPETIEQAKSLIKLWADEELNTLRDELRTLGHQEGGELCLGDKRSKAELSARDIGAGYSQVIPVIAASLDLRNQTCLIEQPELHLHPKLQSELADTFLQSVKAYSNNFFIESHSEHIVLRLLKLIRTARKSNDSFHPEEYVSMVWLTTNHEMRTIAESYELDPQGRGFSGNRWPPDFMDTDEASDQ